MGAPNSTVQRDLSETQRAYAIVSVKEIVEREDAYIIRGMASTPTPDRVGDIVEPLGAQFKLPMPLLWQHDSRKPVGLVTLATPKKTGIPFEASLPKVKESGVLRDRIEEAVQSIKYKLVAAVSIGFRAFSESVEMLKDGGLRFLEWEWLELSLVTIPANAEATIESVKSADALHLRAAPGTKQAAGVRLDTPTAGASARPAAPKQGPITMNYAEQIKSLEATRAAKSARLVAIQEKASTESRTKDENERAEFETLGNEIKAIDVELKDLRDLEKLHASTAAPVNPEVVKAVPHGAGARVEINAKLEPGVKFARMALCVARAHALGKSGHYTTPEAIYRAEKRWMDTAPEVAIALKTAVNGLDSTTSTAASEWAYAQNIASEFIEYLRPRTLAGRIQGWRRVPFNVRVGGMDGGATGYWVGQGLAVPVSKPTSTSVSLGITKVGGLCVITKELAMLSSPSAELMIRNDLAKAIQQKLDNSMFSPQNGGVSNVTPKALTFDATPRAASGTDFAAFKADWKQLTAPFYAANIPLQGSVVVMKEETAEALAMMVTSLGVPQFPSMQDWANGNARLMGLPVFVSQVVDQTGSPDYDNMIVLLQPGEVFLADDGGASVEASDQVSIQMDDGPNSKSTATATGASLVSMFQTESIAIKGIRHINWAVARSGVCQFIRGAAYV